MGGRASIMSGKHFNTFQRAYAMNKQWTGADVPHTFTNAHTHPGSPKDTPSFWWHGGTELSPGLKNLPEAALMAKVRA